MLAQTLNYVRFLSISGHTLFLHCICTHHNSRSRKTSRMLLIDESFGERRASQVRRQGNGELQPLDSLRGDVGTTVQRTARMLFTSRAAGLHSPGVQIHGWRRFVAARIEEAVYRV